MQQSQINQSLSWQPVTPALSELRWLPARFKVLVLTFKTLDVGSQSILPDGHQQRHLGESSADSKDCQWGTVCQRHLDPVIHCTKLPSVLLSCYIFLKNLEKDNLRAGLTFPFMS